MFGHPEMDPLRPPCINPIKWSEVVHHGLLFLGYYIDTRSMTMSWPVAKRQKLVVFLDILLKDHINKVGSSPHSVSRVLGLIRHASFVAPMGNFKSLTLQFHFNDILAKAPSLPLLRRWYQRRLCNLPETIISELQELRAHVSDNLADPYWCRPIGLLVPRTPTITVYSDASTTALGGWSSQYELNHMWRITVNDLVTIGLSNKMGWNNKQNYHEQCIDPMAIHINILEFIALFVELWICLRQLHSAATAIPDPATSPSLSQAPAELIPPGGHRISSLADNTAALSWLRYATRTKREPVRRLARLLTAFLCHPFASASCRLQGRHLAGVLNVSADHLSRYEKSPSWAAVMANCAQLRTLRICLLPQELLSIIACAYLQPQTEELFATEMTQLWTIEPPAFATGSRIPAGTTSSVVHNR
jgi:hypothetical protein